MSYEELVADLRTRLAVGRCLATISEAAAKLGAEAEPLPRGMPWADIRGFGNHLRHGYDRLDLPLIWTTVTRDFAALRAACAAQVPDGAGG